LLDAWRLPAEARGEDMVLVNPDDPPRRVRLVRFDGVPQVQIRSSGKGWDTGGIFSLLTYVRDVDATFAAAQALGWSAYNDPVDMHFGGRTLRNVVLRAWNGVNFGLYRPTVPPPPQPHYAKAGMAFNGQQMVRDIAAARAFYSGVLGWSAWFDGVTRLTCNNFGMPENFVGKLPKNVIIAAGGKDDSGAWAYGQVELVHWDGFAGRDFAARAVPPNLGILGLRIAIPDAVAHARTIEGRGGTLFFGPTRAVITGKGDAQLFGLRSPDGALIEFIQRTQAG
jgi:catechol 2,3-dioxygenase-like lactoylglutathione lyase family enzyme